METSTFKRSLDACQVRSLLEALEDGGTIYDLVYRHEAAVPETRWKNFKKLQPRRAKRLPKISHKNAEIGRGPARSAAKLAAHPISIDAATIVRAIRDALPVSPSGGGRLVGLVQLVRNSAMDSHKRSTQLERLEVVQTGRRRRWSDDEKLRIVAESFQTPRAISSTARRHGISRSLLMTWRRSFSPEPIIPQGEQTGFARAVIAAEVEPAPAGAPPSGQMVIVVGRDRRVIVDAGVDAAALARVLQVLERR